MVKRERERGTYDTREQAKGRPKGRRTRRFGHRREIPFGGDTFASWVDVVTKKEKKKKRRGRRDRLFGSCSDFPATVLVFLVVVVAVIVRSDDTYLLMKCVCVCVFTHLRTKHHPETHTYTHNIHTEMYAVQQRRN